MADLRKFKRLDRVTAGVMSAQNPDTLARLSPLRDRELEEQKIEETAPTLAVEDLEVTGAFLHTGTLFGAYGVPAVARQGPFVQTYSTADPTLGAYTEDVENVAYTGLAAGLGGTPYAAVVDLEALRVAYETLRVHYLDLVQFVNAIVDALQLEGPLS